MKRAFLIVLSLLFILSSHAQSIKVLPSDSAVKSAVMPNGLKCYIVKNPYLKGTADFALVQNTGIKSHEGICSDRLIELSRDGLAGQSRLLSESVQKHFVSLGAVADRDGFVNVTDDATTYHFMNVNLSARPAALDSSLLALMGIVEKVAFCEDTVMRKWYAPSDHAVIVAGDVDPAAVIEKLKMLSYLVPASSSLPRRGYVWKEDGLKTLAEESQNACVSEFSATWKLPRTKRELMNSVQPLGIEKYMQSAGNVARERIAKMLKAQKVPFASLRCNYSLPENYLDDELFTISVKSDPSHIHTAAQTVAAVMSSLSSGKIEYVELKDAILEYYDAKLLQERALTNNIYVRKCASAFLYNESLASDAQKNNYLITRDLPEDKELAIFKAFCAANFKPDVNLTLKCITSDGRVTSDDLRGIFTDSWLKTADFTYDWGTPSLSTSAGKIKVKTSAKEYLTGGTIQTMENGFRVIVKHTDAKDVINWALLSSCGYGNVDDIEPGEASYFSDYFDICRIGGVSADVFRDAVRRRGMTLDVKVGHSATRLSGRIPDDGIEYLLRALLTLMNDAKPDYEAFEYVKECESLRLASLDGSLEERITLIDSVLCPSYKYTICKGGYSRNFVSKAQTLFEQMSGRMDTGVLVLMGDVDEKLLKTMLSMYAGAFKTLGRRPSRPIVNYQPISGTVNLLRAGDENSVDLVLSAPTSLTAENYYASEIMAMCLKQALSEIVTGNGMHVRLKHECTHYPHERVSIMLSLREASVEGFATGTSHYKPEEALARVRGLLKDMADLDITDAELASYKALLKQKIKRETAYPSFWYETLAFRYVEGKDYHSSYESKIDAITKDKVKAMLELLSKGSRIEYVIER